MFGGRFGLRNVIPRLWFHTRSSYGISFSLKHGKEPWVGEGLGFRSVGSVEGSCLPSVCVMVEVAGVVWLFVSLWGSTGYDGVVL